MRIKICGITTPQEGLAAAHAGADALGCLVGVEHLSPDGIPAAAARWVFAALPPYVARVLVTHRATLPEIEDLVAETAATVVQLHGDFPVAEIPRLCSRFPYLTIVKAVPVTGDEADAQARDAARAAHAILLDTRTPGRVGGTGTVHDWSISARIVTGVPVPVILAGGLHAGNVAEAIARVRPWGVDVNTGTKGADGKKSEERMRSFVIAVRSAS